MLMLIMMIGITINSHSQNLTELVGLPVEYEPLKNCVMTGKTSTSLSLKATYTFKRVNRKNVVDTAWAYNLKTVSDTSAHGFALNMVYHYLYEYGYSHTTGMNMEKPESYKTVPIGPQAGKTFYHGYSTVMIEEVPGGYDMIVLSYPFMNTEKRSGAPAITPWQTYNMEYVNALNSKKVVSNYGTIDAKKPWLESKLGLTEEWISNNTSTIYHFRIVNPNTHVCSIFGMINKVGDVYSNATLINGEHYMNLPNYKNLKTPWGGTLGNLYFSWVLYNYCEIPNKKKTDADATGNFGQCFQEMYSQSDQKSLYITVVPGSSYNYNESTHTLTYDGSKTAVIELIPRRNPAPEKNSQQEGYYNLTKGEKVYSLQGQ